MPGGPDTGQIVVAANGTVEVAPVGTTEPTSIGIALDAAFVPLGLINEDGLTFLDGKTVEQINVWQLFYAARRVMTAKEASIAFVLSQWSETSVPLAFGGGVTVQDIVGEFSYTPPAPGPIDERILIATWVDGVKNYRLIIPQGLVTENVETNMVKSGASELPITFGVIGNATGTPWYLQTDDPALDPTNSSSSSAGRRGDTGRRSRPLTSPRQPIQEEEPHGRAPTFQPRRAASGRGRQDGATRARTPRGRAQRRHHPHLYHRPRRYPPRRARGLGIRPHRRLRPRAPRRRRVGTLQGGRGANPGRPPLYRRGMGGRDGHGRPPGILGLWRLILETFDALEADFARFYPSEPPLPELIFGGPRVPLRRLGNLIVHLPADSAFVKTIAPRLPQTPAPWTTTDHLLAVVAELIDYGNRQFVIAHSKKGSRKPQPLRLRRPKVDGSPAKSGPVSMGSPEALAFFGGRVQYTPANEPPTAEPGS